MFDIGWTEMVVVVVLAIIIIGPKDLPKLIRTIGQWTGRARAMAREFQSSIDDLVREAELDEIKKSVEKAASFDIKGEIENSIDPTGSIDGASDAPAATKSSDDIEAASDDPSASVESAVMEAELDAKQAEWAAAAAPAHSIVPPDDPFAKEEAVEATPDAAGEAERDTEAAVKTGVGS